MACTPGIHLETTIPDGGPGEYTVVGCREESCQSVTAIPSEGGGVSTAVDGTKMKVFLRPSADAQRLSVTVEFREAPSFPEDETVTVHITAPDQTVVKEASVVAQYRTAHQDDCGSCRAFTAEI